MQYPAVAVRIVKVGVEDASHVFDVSDNHTPLRDCLTGRANVLHDQVKALERPRNHVRDPSHTSPENDGTRRAGRRELNDAHGGTHLRVVDIDEADKLVERLGAVNILDGDRHELELHVGHGDQVRCVSHRVILSVSYKAVAHVYPLEEAAGDADVVLGSGNPLDRSAHAPPFVVSTIDTHGPGRRHVAPDASS